MSRRAVCLALLAACVPAPPFQGIGSDGGTDTGDTGGGMVAVNVQATLLDGSGLPAVDALVVFVNPDGQTQSTALTNAMGEAGGEIVEGGTVYVRYRSGAPTLIGIAGVKSGDLLRVGARPNPGPTLTQNVQIQLMTVANATRYNAYTICGSGNSTTLPLTLARDNRCTGPYDILVVAYNGAGTPLAFQQISDQPLAATTIDRSALSWLGLGSVNLSLTGLTTTNAISGTEASMSDGRIMHDWPLCMLPITTSTVSTTCPQALAGDSPRQISFTLTPSDVMLKRQRMRQLGPRTDPYSHDFSPGSRPPWIGAPTSADGVTVTWPTDGAGTAQLFALEATANRANVTHTWRWMMEHPTEATFTLPQLPSELSALTIESSEIVSFRATNVRVNGPYTYDALRANAGLDAFPPDALVEPLFELPGVTTVTRTLP